MHALHLLHPFSSTRGSLFLLSASASSILTHTYLHPTTHAAQPLQASILSFNCICCLLSKHRRPRAPRGKSCDPIHQNNCLSSKRQRYYYTILYSAQTCKGAASKSVQKGPPHRSKLLSLHKRSPSFLSSLTGDPAANDYFSSSGSSRRFVILLRLIPSVDILCSSAEVVGCITPATPHPISIRLKATIKR